MNVIFWNHTPVTCETQFGKSTGLCIPTTTILTTPIPDNRIQPLDYHWLINPRCFIVLELRLSLCFPHKIVGLGGFIFIVHRER